LLYKETYTDLHLGFPTT